jgi:hypothetical protein
MRNDLGPVERWHKESFLRRLVRQQEDIVEQVWVE